MQSWDAASWDRPSPPMLLLRRLPHLTLNKEACLSRATLAAMEVATRRDLTMPPLALVTVAMATGDQLVHQGKKDWKCLCSSGSCGEVKTFHILSFILCSLTLRLKKVVTSFICFHNAIFSLLFEKKIQYVSVISLSKSLFFLS